MDEVTIKDLWEIIGQKESIILLLSRKVTALKAENQALQRQIEIAKEQE